MRTLPTLFTLLSLVSVLHDAVAGDPQFASDEFKPEHLATLTVAAPCTPYVGPWSALGTVYVGAIPEVRVWNLRGVYSTKTGRTNVGATSLFLSGFAPLAPSPLTELAMLQAGDDRDCWTLLNTDTLRPFPKYFLEDGVIRDRHAIVNGDPEYEAYWQVLVLGHYTSAAAFAKSARHDVTYAHLFNEPERYRGQVVHLTGRLVRLHRFDPPDEARGAGVSDLYEGWLMTDSFGENPVCVVFTDLPPGLKIDNEKKLNVEDVSMDGYFYKRYRYKASDSKHANEYRDAPLVIGHGISGKFGEVETESDTSDSWSHQLIWVFVGMVGGSAIVVIGLTFWFRYHDRHVRRRIRASRDRGFVPPVEQSQPPPSGSEGSSGVEEWRNSGYDEE